MPSKPPKAPRLAIATQSEQERKRILDLKRPSADQRGYDYDWRVFRASFLRANPYCSHPGCSAKATEVHHDRRVKVAPHLRLVRSNVKGFCKPHHSAVTAREDSFKRRGD